MIRFVLIALVLVVVFGPQLWAASVIRRYQRLPSTAGQSGRRFARKLLDRLGLGEVKVEVTERGDHYDPIDKAVRLTPPNFEGRSLAALVIAAHEVGHAIQDSERYRPLRLRRSLMKVAVVTQKIGSAMMLAVPLIGLISRSPSVGLISAVLGLTVLGISTVVHLVTLPVELDASYRRALPTLSFLGVLDDTEVRPARRLLKAAALTYLAASLADLLNIWRWLTVFRR